MALYNHASGSDYGWDDYPPSRYLAEKVDQYVIFGESQVGKTMFLDKFLGPNRVNLYNDNRHVLTLDDKLISLDFTDLSSTTLRSADPSFNPSYFTKYLSQAFGVVLIYDVTNLASFEHVTNDAYMYLWTCQRFMESEDVKRRCKCILVGNKVDLVKDGLKEREVNGELAKEWAESQGMRFFETSAKSNEGVRDSVHALIRAVEKTKAKERVKTSSTTEETHKLKSKGKDANKINIISLPSRLKNALRLTRKNSAKP